MNHRSDKQLPASLVRFEDELEEAVGRDGARSRSKRRTRIVVRSTAALAVVGAVALGALNLASNDAPTSVGPAPALSAVDRATKALALTPGTVLHVKMVGIQDNGDGTTATWTDESWQSETAPYNRRQVETSPGDPTAETAFVSGDDQLYDPSTNTIYVSHEMSDAANQKLNHQLSHPKLQIEPGATAGTFVVTLAVPQLKAYRVPKSGPTGARFTVIQNLDDQYPDGKAQLTLSAKQADQLQQGKLQVGWAFRKDGENISLVPSVYRAQPDDSTSPPDPGSPEFRNQILALLNTGGAHAAGHAMIDGQDTIKIVSADGHNTYYVDPATSQPVELDTRGTTGGVDLRFVVYEALSVDNPDALIDLTAQHPDATVNHDPAAYSDAQQRVTPHG